MALDGKVALVTGATQGIGFGIAVELARRGARVFGAAMSEERQKVLAQKFLDAGVSATAVAMDVRDAEDVELILQKIESEFGAISILVNNAGITRDSLAMRLKDDDWDDVIETNLKSVFRVTKAAMRGMMKARFGRIVNITSVVGHLGNAGQANYCASKAGVTGMTKALARELASRNITVNCVAPGFIETSMTDGLDDKHKSTLAASIPLGRFGTVSDISSAVCFLASDEAGYITGSTLHVNGGMFMD